MGNCVSKFKMAAIAIRLSKNEAPKNQVHTGVAEYVKNQVQIGLAEYVKNQTNTGLAEYVGHWKMVSDDIREPEPKLVRLANPPANRLNFDGLDHLIPKGLLRASVLQKSGVTNAMEDFLNEEKKNINQNLEKLTKGTPGTVVIPIQDFIPQKCLLTMSTEEFESKFTNWVSGTEVIQNLDNPEKVSSTLSTQKSLDQIKTMASNMSKDEIRTVGTKGAGGPVGPNRTGGPSRLNDGSMDQLAKTMASMSMGENRAVDTGGARGPPEGASGTGVWCNGVWFPTFGETIEDLDDFTNPSMDENPTMDKNPSMDKNQESNGPMETSLKNGASGSEVNQGFNPRKVSLTLPTQNLESMDQLIETMDQLIETMASSKSMGANKKAKNVAMAGILRQAAARSSSARVESWADGLGGAGGAAGAKGIPVIYQPYQKVSTTLSTQERLDQIKTMASNISTDENRAVGPGGAGGAAGAKGTRVIQDLNLQKVPSTLSIQERLDQIKNMASNMSMDENMAVSTEGTGGPVGPSRTGGSSNILRQAATRSSSAIVESRTDGPGGAGGASCAKAIRVIYQPYQKVSTTLSTQERLDQIKTMASNMSMNENRAVGIEAAGGSLGPNRTRGSSGILRQAATKSPSATVENKALGPGAASAADFAQRVKATPDFGLHLRLRDGE